MRNHGLSIGLCLPMVALLTNVFGQGSLNVQYSSGDLYLQDLNSVDSVMYDTVPEPAILNVYLFGTPDLAIPVDLLDSVTVSPAGPLGGALLATCPPLAVTGTCALVGSLVTNEGATSATSTGICWGLSPLPTIADATISTGIPYLRQYQVLMGLEPTTTYYARAYATNAAGTSYGNQVRFTTTVMDRASWLDEVTVYGTMSDTDGNSYPTVVIGGQEWMAEDLRTTSYANGNPIPNVPSATAWEALPTGAWCHYGNNPDFDVPYGKLYNWYTVSDPRNICPNGWHVPSDAEWTTLADAFGGNVLAGEALKSTVLWKRPAVGTNESGFSALPGGVRILSPNASFDGHAQSGNWWTTTVFGANSAWGRSMTWDSYTLTRTDYPRRHGMSVRCLRN